jgi:hypothetical protein
MSVVVRPDTDATTGGGYLGVVGRGDSKLSPVGRVHHKWQKRLRSKQISNILCHPLEHTKITHRLQFQATSPNKGIIVEAVEATKRFKHFKIRAVKRPSELAGRNVIKHRASFEKGMRMPSPLRSDESSHLEGKTLVGIKDVLSETSPARILRSSGDVMYAREARLVGNLRHAGATEAVRFLQIRSEQGTAIGIKGVGDAIAVGVDKIVGHDAGLAGDLFERNEPV